MSIGETLARARRDAGLSIADISRLTRISLSIIDDIEHDDYSACGGVQRTRDNIAAIARAVGADAGFLIEAYDAARRPASSGWVAASMSSEPILPAQPPEALTRWPEPEPAPEPAAEDTQPITLEQPPEPVTTGQATGAAVASLPVLPAVDDRRPVIWIALGAALLVAAALGGILLIVGASGQATRRAVVAGRHPDVGPGATHRVRTRPSPGRSAGSHRRTRSASPATSRPVRALVPASITAFGPGGAGQGDSPELAHQALAGRVAAPWHSAWYTTAHFGNLQSGTGLLLDMGRAVTITSARIALGDHSGTNLTVRVGNSPTLGNLRPVAHANDAGSLVRLKTARARGRYVLVWFTRLPEDQAGTFQVAVYDIKLRGFR